MGVEQDKWIVCVSDVVEQLPSPLSCGCGDQGGVVPQRSTHCIIVYYYYLVSRLYKEGQ